MDGEEKKYSKHKASVPNEKTESLILINFHAACQRFKVLTFGTHSELRGEQNYSRSAWFLRFEINILFALDVFFFSITVASTDGIVIYLGFY